MKLPPTTFDSAQSCFWFLLAMVTLIVLTIRHDIRKEKNESRIQ